MKNLKFILEVLSFIFIGLPVMVFLYLSNEIFWAVKKLKDRNVK
jgi:hypothetical protein